LSFGQNPPQSREAGGTVTDFAGKPFSILGEETLASNGLIHAEMLDALKLMGV